MCACRLRIKLIMQCNYAEGWSHEACNSYSLHGCLCQCIYYLYSFAELHGQQKLTFLALILIRDQVYLQEKNFTDLLFIFGTYTNLTYTHLHSLNLLNFNELLFIFQFNWRLLINLIAVGCISVHDEHYAAMAYYTPAQCMISIAYCCMFI